MQLRHSPPPLRHEAKQPPYKAQESLICVTVQLCNEKEAMRRGAESIVYRGEAMHSAHNDIFTPVYGSNNGVLPCPHPSQPYSIATTPPRHAMPSVYRASRGSVARPGFRGAHQAPAVSPAHPYSPKHWMRGGVALLIHGRDGSSVELISVYYLVGEYWAQKGRMNECTCCFSFLLIILMTAGKLPTSKQICDTIRKQEQAPHKLRVTQPLLILRTD